MCGIFGWWLPGASRRERDRLGFALALLNTQRGSDSWGWHDPMEGLTMRGLGAAASVPARKWGAHILLMGHCRAGTTGGVTLDNSHPFEVRGSHRLVVGAHNGIITNHAELNAKYKRDCTVDSQHLFWHLATGRDFEDVEGWGAIEWAEDGGPVLHLCKLSDRADLAVMQVAGGLVWSSSQDHLGLAIEAARLHPREHYKIETGRVYLVDPKASELMVEKERRLTLKTGWSFLGTGFSPRPDYKTSWGQWDDDDLTDDAADAEVHWWWNGIACDAQPGRARFLRSTTDPDGVTCALCRELVAEMIEDLKEDDSK